MEDTLILKPMHKELPPEEWEQLLARLREINAPVYHWRETPPSITVPEHDSGDSLCGGYLMAGRPLAGTKREIDGEPLTKEEIDEIDGPRLTDGQPYAGWLERKGDVLELWTIWCRDR